MSRRVVLLQVNSLAYIIRRVLVNSGIELMVPEELRAPVKERLEIL